MEKMALGFLIFIQSIAVVSTQSTQHVSISIMSLLEYIRAPTPCCVAKLEDSVAIAIRAQIK